MPGCSGFQPSPTCFPQTETWGGVGLRGAPDSPSLKAETPGRSPPPQAHLWSSQWPRGGEGLPGLGSPVPSVPLPGHPPRRKGLGKVDSPLGWEGVSLIPVPTEGSLHQPQDLSRYIRPHFIASCPVSSCPPTHAIPPEQPLQASQPDPSESSCVRRVGSRQAGHCYLRRAWTSHPAGLPCGCVPGHSGLSLTQ